MEKGLSFLEFNYMIMQSYDFCMLYQKYGLQHAVRRRRPVELICLGGTELIRRKLRQRCIRDDHYRCLLNSEGKKMGKTQSGAVWLDPNKTSPFEFYQYWRNVADADVLKCLRMLTFLPLEQIDEMDKWEGSQLNHGKGDSGVRADQAGTWRGRGQEGTATGRKRCSPAEMPRKCRPTN
ncbi:MAG: hypothetical protein ACLUUO_01350 [Sellimonas intestinalis]